MLADRRANIDVQREAAAVLERIGAESLHLGARLFAIERNRRSRSTLVPRGSPKMS